jgi:integrase/recombinase XerD
VNISQQSGQYIEQFVQAMWLEKGLSENTLSAYRSDLTKFALFLSQHSEHVNGEQLAEFG